MRRIAIIVCLFILLGGSTAYLLHRPAKPPPFVVLQRPFKFPVTARDRVDQLIAKTWPSAFSWGLERMVFGQRKPILLDGEIFSFADPSRTTSALALAKPNFSDPAGLQIWLLNAEELKALASRLKQTPGTAVSYHPRVMTADGISASMSSVSSVQINGTNYESGLTLECLPNVHKGFTDLIASIRCSELVLTNNATVPGDSPVSLAASIQTNLDTAVRLQIPNGSGIFLMDASPANPGQTRTGLLIDLPRPKP